MYTLDPKTEAEITMIRRRAIDNQRRLRRTALVTLAFVGGYVLGLVVIFAGVL